MRTLATTASNRHEPTAPLLLHLLLVMSMIIVIKLMLLTVDGADDDDDHYVDDQQWQHDIPFLPDYQFILKRVYIASPPLDSPISTFQPPFPLSLSPYLLPLPPSPQTWRPA